jgi:Ca2+-binding EF-hand superfamily protein
MILKSESFRKKSFSDLDKNQDGFIDKQELADAVKNIPKVCTEQLPCSAGSGEH